MNTLSPTYILRLFWWGSPVIENSITRDLQHNSQSQPALLLRAITSTSLATNLGQMLLRLVCGQCYAVDYLYLFIIIESLFYLTIVNCWGQYYLQAFTTQASTPQKISKRELGWIILPSSVVHKYQPYRLLFIPDQLSESWQQLFIVNFVSQYVSYFLLVWNRKLNGNIARYM